MTKQQRLQQYGITTNEQAIQVIKLVCDILGNGGKNNAHEMLIRTAMSESQMGNYPDSSKDYGESIFQFDEIAFYDTIERTRAKDVNLVHKHFGFWLEDMQYSDLRNNIVFACVMARLKYKLVPASFPEDFEGQWKYYKKYWNTESGKATREHFYKMNGVSLESEK